MQLHIYNGYFATTKTVMTKVLSDAQLSGFAVGNGGGNDILDTLHRNNNDEQNLVPNEVQGNVLCSNSSSQLCTSLGVKYHRECVELGKTFKSIHIRLLAMGYKINNGKITK